MSRANKPIQYEKHALKRMKQRAITKEEIEEAISDPDERRPAKRPNAIRIIRRLNDAEMLNVILEETESFIRIISTWIQNG